MRMEWKACFRIRFLQELTMFEYTKTQAVEKMARYQKQQLKSIALEEVEEIQ
jgi:hypothetical protein